MKRFITIAAVGLAIVMALPAVEAANRVGWGSYQAWEPDTTLDVTGGYMYLAPPTSTQTNHIYFNVVSAFDAGPNVNSGLLGSRIGSPNEVVLSNAEFLAELGVWVDCNHDGYVGLADGAMREYRVEVSQAAGFPVDTGICPAKTPTGNPPTEPQGTHNGGGWVTEMLPIGFSVNGRGERAPNSLDSRFISDLDSNVWGDPGLPDAAVGVADPDPCHHGSSIFPDRGESQDTGTWFTYMDCHGTGPHALWANVVGRDDTGTLAGVVPDPAPLYAPGGPLQMATFGSDDSHDSIVSGEQDCSQAPIEPTPDRPNGHPGQSGIRNPGNVAVNPSGTVPATVNETVEETPTDDCDTSNDGGRDFYGNIESSGDGSVVAEKHRATANFGFRPWNTRWGCSGVASKICGQPQDAGLPGAYNPQGVGGNLWASGSRQDWDFGGVGVDTTRDTVQPNIAPGDVWSFFAHVSSTDGAVPSASDGIYGLSACNGVIGAGASPGNGWSCDPALWNEDGNVYDAGAQYEATVGDHFQLRDVDCWDMRVMSADSPENPTQQDIGLRSIPGAADPTHACP